MIVYIVTDGSYSDYGIDKVFLSKEKAEHYVKYMNGAKHSYRDYRVETYETEDEKYKMQPLYTKVEMSFMYRIDAFNNHVVYVTHFNTYTEPAEEKEEPSTTFEVVENGMDYTVVRTYVQGEDYDENSYLEKVKKIGFDLAAEISFLRSEGFTFRNIATTLKR